MNKSDGKSNIVAMKVMYYVGLKQQSLNLANRLVKSHDEDCSAPCDVKDQAEDYIKWYRSKEYKKQKRRRKRVTS